MISSSRKSFLFVCVWVLCVVWVGSVDMYLALATGHDNVDEAAGVENTLVGAALGLLLLLLGLNLDSKYSLGWRFCRASWRR